MRFGIHYRHLRPRNIDNRMKKYRRVLPLMHGAISRDRCHQIEFADSVGLQLQWIENLDL